MMNGKNIIKTITLVVATCLVVATWATPLILPTPDDKKPKAPRDSMAAGRGEVYDSTVYHYLPGEVRDTVTLSHRQQALERYLQPDNQRIKLLTRTYGDSIVLRWSAPDYVTWRYINRVGVDIYRTDPQTGVVEKVAKQLQPTPMDRCLAIYSENDSVALMGIGAIYNLDRSDPITSGGELGGVGSLYDLHEDQQMQLGVAILVSEWRPDVANHLAMRWVDKKVRRGQRYTYSVVPSVVDTAHAIVLGAGVVDNIENVAYKPQSFDVQIRDSVSAPNGVQLWWPDHNYSSYEIERRGKGTLNWQRVNERPYVVMFSSPNGGQCYYGDNVPRHGAYEYRILAHDAFGQTLVSPIHTVNVTDMVAPVAPQILSINIDRPQRSNPSAQVFAEIFFKKDTMEADYVGAMPMYFNERLTEGRWKPLLSLPLARTTKSCRIDVTNLQSGYIVMAAYDTSDNVSYSTPQLLRINDMLPPVAPTGLKATTNAEDGTVILTWDAPENDEIDYYQVLAANDSTHQFIQLKGGLTHEPIYVDTISMEANQKYVYYRVRAVDYGTNASPLSYALQVPRPSSVPPSVAHLDSAQVSGKSIYLRWVAGDDEQMGWHHVLRRKLSQSQWTLLMRCDADSVKARHDYIQLTDTPAVTAGESWVYAVESFNHSGTSSGLSLQSVFSFAGETSFACPVVLHGSYLSQEGETRLAWDMQQTPSGEGEWYFCVYRKGPADAHPQFLLSVQPDERSFSDRLLHPGEQAEYYLVIQYSDGRCSEPSNIVKVTAPK
jgi:hypothetical protein